MPLHFSLRATLTLLPLVALFSSLGVWQWQRMHEKLELMAQFSEAPEQEFGEAVAGNRPFVRVKVSGSYATDWHILRDNRIENGRAGVHVHSLFRPARGPAILVNRGWLPLAPDRRSLPDVPTPAGRIAISGILAPPPDEPVQLGAPDRLDRLRGPALVTYLELDRLSEAQDISLAPYVLLLDPTDASGFGERAWKPAVMPPAQHRAYAVQWFALAAAALTVWLVSGLGRGTHAQY